MGVMPMVLQKCASARRCRRPRRCSSPDVLQHRPAPQQQGSRSRVGRCSGGEGGGKGNSGRVGRCSSSAAVAVAGTGGSSASGREQQRRQRQPRDKLLVIYVNRGDLRWGRPPWKFEQSCSIGDLQLGRQLAALDVSTISTGSEEHQVVASFSVDGNERSGLLVRGTAKVTLPLRCDYCAAPFQHPVTARFQAWLNSGEHNPAEADELPFPQDAVFCDLSPAVVDALITEVPSACLCGGRVCRNNSSARQAVWAATDAGSSSSGGSSSSSPFAKLLRRPAVS